MSAGGSDSALLLPSVRLVLFPPPSPSCACVCVCVLFLTAAMLVEEEGRKVGRSEQREQSHAEHKQRTSFFANFDSLRADK